MKLLLKAAGEFLLGNRLVLRAIGSIRPNDGVVLAYHNVVEPGPVMGDTSLHLPRKTFLRQVDWLADTFDVVSLTTFLNGSAGLRPRAVITFDDAYEGAVRLALPALIERGLPATVFVVSSWVGGETTWWDAIAEDQGLSDSLRAEALNRHSGLGLAVMQWARADGIALREVCRDCRIASTEAIRQIASSPLVSIAMHSHTHVNLCALTDVELGDELASSFRETRAVFPNALPWLAFPYGLVNTRVADAARAAGFEGGLRVKGGPVRCLHDIDRFSVPRVYVPRDLSLAGFRMRTVGIR